MPPYCRRNLTHHPYLNSAVQVEGKSVDDPRRDSLPSSMMSDIVWTSYIIVYISCGCCRYVIYTGRQYTVHTRRDKAKSRTPSALAGLLFVGVCRSPEYTAPASVSAGDAFYNAGMRARHRLCGRDSVFDQMSDMQEKRARKVNQLTFVCLLTSPIDCPCTQRYRGNDPCHLSATDTTFRKSRIYSRGIANVR